MLKTNLLDSDKRDDTYKLFLTKDAARDLISQQFNAKSMSWTQVTPLSEK